MFIDQYYSEPDGRISFTRRQASEFAKRVADDFNPLHDEGARKFCVPGDLLFAVTLSRYGLSRHMEFVFSGMVTEGVELVLPPAAQELVIRDGEEREYLRVARSGETSHDQDLIQKLIRSYVAFSGHTFPHILEPLLAAQQVMINPARPVVIYASMAIDLDRLDVGELTLQSDSNELQIEGKRGAVSLLFNLLDDGKVVGRGRKHMLLSGLRPYDGDVMAAAIATYNERKRVFFGR